MSSLTDIIFLLLIFFMVTSTVIQPTALDVSLPQSEVQTTLKPQTEVYIDSLGIYSIVENRMDSVNPMAAVQHNVDINQLAERLATIHQADSTRALAIYADEKIDYGRVVRVLNIAAKVNMRAVLATRPGAEPVISQP